MNKILNFFIPHIEGFTNYIKEENKTYLYYYITWFNRIYDSYKQEVPTIDLSMYLTKNKESLFTNPENAIYFDSYLNDLRNKYADEDHELYYIYFNTMKKFEISNQILIFSSIMTKLTKICFNILWESSIFAKDKYGHLILPIFVSKEDLNSIKFMIKDDKIASQGNLITITYEE